LGKSISQTSNSQFSISALIRRKWKIGQRLLRDDGVMTLLVEIFCQLTKPAVWLFDSIRLQWYQIRGKKSFIVLGSEMAVLPKDPGISRELALYKIHEPLATHLLMKTLEPGMNVVDIGGNIGYYAMLEARMVGVTGQVIAIEPMPKNSEQLCNNVRNNGYRQIQIYKMAIGDRNGTASMYVSGKSNWHSLRRNPSTVGEIQVPVSTLDSLLSSLDLASVDLVRMDLEGYEVVVINGMLQAIEKYSPRLLVELHPDLLGKESMLEYLGKLERLGYNVEWLFEQERDLPLRWRFLRIETPTMRELMRDSRICTEPRAMTALFVRGNRRDMATHEAEHNAWQPAPADGRSMETEALARSGLSRRATSSTD